MSDAASNQQMMIRSTVSYYGIMLLYAFLSFVSADCSLAYKGMIHGVFIVVSLALAITNIAYYGSALNQYSDSFIVML